MASTDYISRSEAAALAATEISKVVYSELPKRSACLQLMKTINMGSSLYSMPVTSTLPTASWLAGTTNGAAVGTQQAWETKTLTAEELVVVMPISRASFEDASFDVAGLIMDQGLNAIASALDSAILFGTNAPASMPDSIYEATTVTSKITSAHNILTVAASALDIQLSQLMAKPEADGFIPDGWVAGIGQKSKLRELRTSTGAMLFQEKMVTGLPDTLYGMPIVFVGHDGFPATSASIIVGSWKNGIVGIREDVRIKIFDSGIVSDGSTIGTDLISSDSLAVRLTFRAGFQIVNPLNRIGGSAQYPWATLKPVGWA